MNILSVITAVLTLLAGIGVFLIACTMMSSNLESASSKRLKRLFAKTGDNKWLGVAIGTVGTAAIQSSGAVTVMVIGFVNVGIMSLAQAATIIYGANIGTTVTAQLVALGLSGSNSISTTLIFSALAGIGAFIMLFTKSDAWKQAGGVLTGFGMLFVGLSMMSNAMDEFAALHSVKLFLASIRNPLLLVLLGTIITAIIQSSSVMTSIAITMVVTGLIALDQGIYLTMGSNIGSCVVAIIAGMTSGVAAKRTAMIHLLFNVLGVVLFLCAALTLSLVTAGVWSFGTIFERLFPAAPQLQLAMFHTVFNVTTMLVALPLTGALVALACKIIKDQPKTETDQPHLYFLDEQMLRTPVVAVRQLKAEIDQMESLVVSLYEATMQAYHKMDMEALGRANQIEDEIDRLTDEMERNHIQRLSLGICEPQAGTEYISLAQNSERVADHLINVAKTIRQLQ